MPVASDVKGKVFRHGSAVFMARVVNASGQTINQASVSAIEYTVYELTTDDPSGLSAVTGHTGVALTVGDVIYDTLQDDDAWTPRRPTGARPRRYGRCRRYRNGPWAGVVSLADPGQTAWTSHIPLTRIPTPTAMVCSLGTPPGTAVGRYARSRPGTRQILSAMRDQAMTRLCRSERCALAAAPVRESKRCPLTASFESCARTCPASACWPFR